MRLFFSVIVSLGIFLACKPTSRSLPILGEIEIVDGDTVYHSIPDFSLVDHHGDTITNQTFDQSLYVADFFFTKCPTICPKLAQQMLRLHDRYQGNNHVKFLSHSIDPKYDTVAALKKYADKLGVANSTSWHFVCVPKDDITQLALQYFAAAQVDPFAAGGYIHSGHFVLVDKKRHIRSFCDGTKPTEVDRLMKDIDLLLSEKQD